MTNQLTDAAVELRLWMWIRFGQQMLVDEAAEIIQKSQKLMADRQEGGRI